MIINFVNTEESYLHSLSDFRESFNNAVKNKEYKGLTYPSWRSLCNKDIFILTVHFFSEPEEHQRFVTISYLTTEHPFDDVQFGKYNYDDNSLGQFIFEHYITKNKKKEKEKMSEVSKMFNFDFGPVNDDHYRMSPFGLAINTSRNGWIAYNGLSEELVNVEVFNFSIKNFLYKMPAAIEALCAGDVIIHGSRPMFVKGVNKDGTIKVISYDGAAVMDILPVKSPFGFSFVTKIVSLIDFSQIKADSKNPFGNMLPFLMMGDKDLDFLPFLMMNQNLDFMNNPMMLYALMGGNKSDNKDLLLMMMLMNQKEIVPPCNKTEKGNN